MPKKFHDIIRLDFEVKSKGADRLSKIAKDLERLEKAMSKLQKMGAVLGDNFEPIKKNNKELKETGTTFDKLRKKIKAFKADFKEGIAENIGKTAGKIVLFAALTGPIIKLLGFLAEITKSVVELEESMTRVSTVTRASGQSMSSALHEIRSEILKTARDVKGSFQEIAVAAYAAGSAGLTVGQQIASIRPITNLVVGTLGDMEFTAKLVTGAFNVFSEQLGSARTDMEKLNAISDTIADTYSRQQIELSELEAGFRVAGSAASLLDVSFNELVTTLGFLNTGMLKGSRAGISLMNATIALAKESDKLKETYVVSFDPTKPLKFKDIIMQVAEQIREGGVSAEELGELIEVFGRRGGRAVAQIVNDMDRYMQAVGRSEEDTRHMAEVLARIQSNTLAGSFDRMKNSLGESLVLLNDIVPVTRTLSLLFKGIALTVGGVNDVLRPIGKVTGGLFDFIGLKKEQAFLKLHEARLKAINQQIEFMKQHSAQAGISNFKAFESLFKQRDKIQNEIGVRSKLVQHLAGTKEDDQAPTSKLSEGQVETLPKKVREAVKEADAFLRLSELSRSTHGDLLKIEAEINGVVDQINKKIEIKNKSESESNQHAKIQKLNIGENLVLTKKTVDEIEKAVGLSSKFTSSSGESAKVIGNLAKLYAQVVSRVDELDKLQANIFRNTKHQFAIETLRAQNKKNEVILQAQTQFYLDGFNKASKTSLTIEEARTKTRQELLDLGRKDQKSLEATQQLLTALDKEKLNSLKKQEEAVEQADKKSLRKIRTEGKMSLSLLKAQKADNKQLVAEKLKFIDIEIAATQKILDAKNLDEQKTKAISNELDKLIEKKEKLLFLQQQTIPMQDQSLKLFQDFNFISDLAVMQADSQLEKYHIQIGLIQELNELAKTNTSLIAVQNQLKEEGLTIEALTKGIIMEQAEEARQLEASIKEGIKESLFDSLVNAEKLDVALNKAADTVGRILLKRNFDKVMDQIFKAFDMGGVTIESQLEFGGDKFVQKLKTELPSLFTQLGQMTGNEIKKAVQSANIEGGGAGGMDSVLGPGGGKAAKTGKEFSFGGMVSGALSGAALANARGRDQQSQTAAAVGGAAGQVIGTMIGGPIGGAIGGLLGGFAGSLFGGDKKEQKAPEPPEVAFKLDVSNTLLRDINRNLTAIREDSTAFSLQRSFYFSASQQQGIPSIIFEGDMIFGQNQASEGGFTAQDVGEVLVQRLSEEGVRGSQ